VRDISTGPPLVDPRGDRGSVSRKSDCTQQRHGLTLGVPPRQKMAARPGLPSMPARENS
jgi:hypothetical protein